MAVRRGRARVSGPSGESSPRRAFRPRQVSSALDECRVASTRLQIDGTRGDVELGRLGSRGRPSSVQPRATHHRVMRRARPPESPASRTRSGRSPVRCSPVLWRTKRRRRRVRQRAVEASRPASGAAHGGAVLPDPDDGAVGDGHSGGIGRAGRARVRPPSVVLSTHPPESATRLCGSFTFEASDRIFSRASDRGAEDCTQESATRRGMRPTPTGGPSWSNLTGAASRAGAT